MKGVTGVIYIKIGKGIREQGEANPNRQKNNEIDEGVWKNGGVNLEIMWSLEMVKWEYIQKRIVYNFFLIIGRHIIFVFTLTLF